MSQHSGSKGSKPGSIGLNIDQSKAARKALAARDYLLISGKPGTGKTTAIVVLIHMLITSGKTVLVTAYTHSAVDNICLKLKERGIDFLRIGGKHQVHSDIHSYIPNYEKNVKTFADIERKSLGSGYLSLTPCACRVIWKQVYCGLNVYERVFCAVNSKEDVWLLHPRWGLAAHSADQSRSDIFRKHVHFSRRSLSGKSRYLFDRTLTDHPN